MGWNPSILRGEQSYLSSTFLKPCCIHKINDELLGDVAVKIGRYPDRLLFLYIQGCSKIISRRNMNFCFLPGFVLQNNKMTAPIFVQGLSSLVSLFYVPIELKFSARQR